MYPLVVSQGLRMVPRAEDTTLLRYMIQMIQAGLIGSLFCGTRTTLISKADKDITGKGNCRLINVNAKSLHQSASKPASTAHENIIGTCL